MVISKRISDFPRGKIKNSKKLKTGNEFDDDDVIVSRRKRIYIEQINVKNISIGTIILGCIQDIKDYEIRVTLPGCINCIIPITNISKEYTRLLKEFAQNPLKNKKPLKPQSLFKIGQQVIVKVLYKKNDDFVIDETFIPYVNVRGTIDPEDIYENLNEKIFLKSCKNFIIAASIKSIEDHGYVMDIGMKNIVGFLKIDKTKYILDLLKLKSLNIGQVLCCAVLETNDKVVQLSCEQLDLLNIKIDDNVRGNFSENFLLPGLNVVAKIVDIQENGLEILLFDEFLGFILKDHLKTIWDLPEKSYEIGSDINATILYKNINTKHLALTLRNNYESNALVCKWKIKIGQIFKKASVVAVDKKGNVTFRLSDNIRGIAPINELSDDYMNTDDLSLILSKYSINSRHEARVKSFSFIDGYVKLTLKPSLLNIQETPLDNIHIGSIIKGKVKQLNENGLILKIGFAEKAFVPKIHLTENPMSKNLDKLFPLNKEVTGRIFRLDKTSDPPKICVTLKKSLLSSSLYILDSLDKVKPNIQTDGVVCLIKDSGLLLEFFNRLRAWVSKVHVINKDLSVYRVGQVVKATIIKVEKEKCKIYATLLNSLVEKTPLEIKKEKILSLFYWSKLKVFLEKKAIKDHKKALISDCENIEQVVNEINNKDTLNKINLGFNWDFDFKNANQILNSSSDEESVNSDQDLNDNSRKQVEKKKKTSREYEEYLRNKENNLLDSQREPKTKDDFERMLINSPNSSLVWIKYMEMYIEQKLYDKSRQVGERALQTIYFREEQEKFNIWVALMNIENEFGNEESFSIIYRRAQMKNNSFKIFTSLIKIYVSSEKFDKAEEAYAFHVKKFKFLKQFWLDYGLFLYRYNKIDKARNVLEQCLKSLEKIDHIDTISKFAQMEFKCGDVERGKTLFENLLSTYPKRLDLWLIYIDVMQKYGRYEEYDNKACLQAIRNIFERIINLNFKPIRMKSIYKKYLDFEGKFGNKTTLERIKEKMKSYVNENTLDK